MSFSSPLLASLRRPGAEEGASHPSAPSDEDFLRRKRTPGTTERPAGSGTPLFASNNATAQIGHRPSPLGLPQSYPITEAGAGTPVGTPTATTPSGNRFLGAGSRTPTSTGTNFKARLAAMQAAGTPKTAGATPPTFSSITTGLGLARSGQLGWTSTGLLPSSRRGTGTSTLLTRQQQQQQAGLPPPPGTSLEDELLNLKIDSYISTSDGDKAATTPAKSGMITRPGRATRTAVVWGGEEERTPATPTTTPVTTTSKGTLPYFSFTTSTRTTTPSITSTKGVRTKGKKAVGAGALSVARSPRVLGGIAGTTSSKEIEGEPSIHHVPKTDTDGDVASRHVYGGTQQEREHVDLKKEKEEEESSLVETDQGGIEIHSLQFFDARSLQHRLRSQLPEFGISEWSPPLQQQGALAALTTLNPKPVAATVEKTKALKELATLRSQADVKLEGAFITRIIGHEGDTEPQRKGKEEKYTPVALDDDDDMLCRGVRRAFKATQPELTLPSTTPEAAQLPSNSSLCRRTSASSVSPLERGTRRGSVADKGDKGHVAIEIEERLERLKLLRNQANQVTGSTHSSSSTRGSTTPGKS